MKAYLIQIDARDSAGDPMTMRFASHDDAGLCHHGGQIWWPAIARLPSLSYDFFDGGFRGDISNPSGSFSVSMQAFPDMASAIWSDAAFTLYWMDFDDSVIANLATLFVGRVRSQPRFSGGRADIDFESDDRWLDEPLLDTYTGTGGVEGPDGLEGAVKPLLLGSPRFAPGVLIDAVDNVYQLSAYGAIQGVEAVYDRLSSLGVSTGDHADLAALLAATIANGSWATCLSLGLVRLGAPPDGQVCFHVIGDNVGGWSRLPGALISRIATIAGGVVSTASLTAISVSRPYNLSVALTDQITARELIQSIAASIKAVAGVDWSGDLFVAPLAITSAVKTLNSDGSSLPAIAEVNQLPVDPPFWRLATEAEKTWVIHGDADIAYQYNFRGAYATARVYRLDDVVSTDDGSTWRFVGVVPLAGSTPSDANANWERRSTATVVDFTNVADIPAELTDGRITGGLDVDGNLISGINTGGPLQVSVEELAGNQTGNELAIDPDFARGIAPDVYNSAGGSAVTRAITTDTAAPNASKKKLVISYDGVGPSSLGFGGFTLGLVKGSQAKPGFYVEGAVIQYYIIAKIPVGRTLALAVPSVGTGSSFDWLTSVSGSGSWKTYMIRQVIGIGGTFASAGLFYVTGGTNIAFDWEVARASAIHQGVAPRTAISNSLIDVAGNALTDPGVITAQGNSAGFTGEGVLARENTIDAGGPLFVGTLPVTKADTALKNTSVSIAANGTLSGAGGGAVTYPGLGGKALGLKDILTFGDAEFREAGATVATLVNFKTALANSLGFIGEGTLARKNSVNVLTEVTGGISISQWRETPAGSADCLVLPNYIKMTSGVTGYRVSAVSGEKIPRGCRVAGVVAADTQNIFMGLTTLNNFVDAAAEYNQMEFSIGLDSGGIYRAYELGVFKQTLLTGGAAGDTFEVRYRGTSVEFVVNGTVLRTTTTTAGLSFRGAVCFNTVNKAIYGLNFTPYADGVKLDGVENGANVTANYNSLGFIGEGTLARKNAVDLTSGEVTNKSLANLDSTANTKLSGVEAFADVTKNKQITIDPVSSYNLQANSSSETTTVLPETRTVKVRQGGTLLASGVVFSMFTTPAGMTASVGASTGIVSLSVANAVGTLVVKAVFDGVDYFVPIMVNRTVAAPISGGASGSPSFIDSTWNNISTTSDVQVTDVGAKVRSDGSGQIRYSASASYSGSGSAAITMQYSLDGSSWTNFAAAVTGGPAIPGEPGYVDIAAATKTGLTASTDYFVRTVAKRVGGSGTLSWVSPNASFYQP